MSKTQERSRSKSPGPVIRTSKKRDVPPGVCRFEFNRRGSCKFVDCQFRHEGFIPRLDPRDSSVCFDFQNKGECKRGDDCRFGHTDPKSSVCRDFQVGRCRHGDKCRFQHKYDQRAMPPAPIDWRRPSAPPPRYTPYDAPPADRYGSGYGGPQSYGRYGSGYGQPPADRYSQGYGQPPADRYSQGYGQPPVDRYSQGGSSYGQPPSDRPSGSKVCFDFQNKGKCLKDNCRFEHLDAQKSECMEFSRGYCRRGDQCRFVHDQARVMPGAAPLSQVSPNAELLCYQFQSYGTCYVNNCKFRHSY
eukprot:61539_1